MKNARGSVGSEPQMTAAEFAAALKTHGFRVVRAKIEDTTGGCPGVRWPAILRGTSIDRNRTLAKVLRERDAEIARRTARPVPLSRDAKPDRDHTAKGRMTALEVRRKHANARAAELAPIIAELQAAGVTSLRAIADGLNAQNIPTARGNGSWSAVQVARVLERI